MELRAHGAATKVVQPEDVAAVLAVEAQEKLVRDRATDWLEETFDLDGMVAALLEELVPTAPANLTGTIADVAEETAYWLQTVVERVTDELDELRGPVRGVAA